MESITYAILGGALIGLAATILLMTHGRIAGISGILGSLLHRGDGDAHWRYFFLLGLLIGGGPLVSLMPETIVPPRGRSLGLVGIAGVFVGYGTRLGNGCTSGHGVCGLSRLSIRSLVATVTFMVTGFTTATLIGWLGS